MRHDFYINRNHLNDKIRKIKHQKDKVQKVNDANYILALQQEQKVLENKIIKEIKLHPPSYNQEILGGTRTRISEL